MRCQPNCRQMYNKKSVVIIYQKIRNKRVASCRQQIDVKHQARTMSDIKLATKY